MTRFSSDATNIFNRLVKLEKLNIVWLFAWPRASTKNSRKWWTRQLAYRTSNQTQISLWSHYGWWNWRRTPTFTYHRQSPAYNYYALSSSAQNCDKKIHAEPSSTNSVYHRWSFFLPHWFSNAEGTHLIRTSFSTLTDECFVDKVHRLDTSRSLSPGQPEL